jgi:hypothetical protein
MAVPKSRRREARVTSADPAVVGTSASSGAPPRERRTIQILVLLLLAAVSLISTVQRAAANDGIDFYNLWGVPAALRLSGRGIGSPYTDGAEYLATLKSRAATAGDAKFASAGDYWKASDYTGSPLLYAAFGAFPLNYTRSLAVFQLLQLVAFLATCILLGRLYELDLVAVSCLALVCLMGYQPVLSDLRVANLGCVQFGLLGGLLAWARALPRVRSQGRRVVLGGFLLAALAALTLAKPNVALITGLLAAHVTIRLGARQAAIAALPVIGVTAAFVIVPCLYFGSWQVWAEWYRFVYGSDAHMLVRRVADGNDSSIVLLSSWLGAGVYTTASVVLGLLGASLLGVARWARGAGEDRRSLKDAAVRIVRCLGDSPDLVLAIGVTVTMATAPLFWIHYYVISLFPCIWLFATPTTSRFPARLAGLALIASSGIPGLLLAWIGVANAMWATTATTWIPLWGAVLIVLADVRRSGAEGGEAQSPTAEATP